MRPKKYPFQEISISQPECAARRKMIMAQNFLVIPFYMPYDATRSICCCAMPGPNNARNRRQSYQAREQHSSLLFRAVVGSHAGQIRCSIPSKLDYQLFLPRSAAPHSVVGMEHPSLALHQRPCHLHVRKSRKPAISEAAFTAKEQLHFQHVYAC